VVSNILVSTGFRCNRIFGHYGNGNGNGHAYGHGNNEEDAAALEDLVSQSAAANGVDIGGADYGEYSEKLVKTLSMLSAAQQARVFQ
jgi:hypothetical protein